MEHGLMSCLVCYGFIGQLTKQQLEKPHLSWPLITKLWYQQKLK